MNLDPFKGPGSTPSRRRFWERVTSAVIASQKVSGGRFVTVDEHEGQGTVINVDYNRRGPPGAGCCDFSSDITVVITGTVLDCGCIDTTILESGILSVTAEGSADGTYILSHLDDTTWATSGVISIHFKAWTGNTGCSGTPDSDFTEIGYSIFATCDPVTGNYTVLFNSSAFAFFLGTGDSTMVPNETTCGEVNTDTPFGQGLTIGAGNSGSAVVTCP